MDVQRPRLLVELGTFTGFSYLAFCQALEHVDGARAFAVDTWLGDEHNGFYGEEVFEELLAYHDPRYGSFSTLLRSSFDHAVERFEDGSIDLLHIDGLHLYEVVRHDFETWQPKLSDRALVLFHDTNMRERGFGVAQLWEELTMRFPGFEFPHDSGLGVLGVGSAQPDRIATLLSASGTPAEQSLRAAYKFLGSAIRAAFEASTLHGNLGDTQAELRKVEADLRKVQADLRDAQATKDSRIAELEARLGDAERYAIEHADRADELEAALEELRTHNVVARGTTRARGNQGGPPGQPDDGQAWARHSLALVCRRRASDRKQRTDVIRNQSTRRLEYSPAPLQCKGSCTYRHTAFSSSPVSRRNRPTHAGRAPTPPPPSVDELVAERLPAPPPAFRLSHS